MKAQQIVALVTLLSAGMVGGAQAQTSTWNAGSGTWNTAGNWSPAAIPATGTNLVFDGSGSGTITITDNTPTNNTSYGTVTFNDAGSYVLNPSGSASNQIRTGNIADNSTSVETINLKIDNASVRNITVASGGDLVLGGIYSGTGINANGSGTLTLSAVDTYTGTTTISGGGTVAVTGSTASGNGVSVTSGTLIANGTVSGTVAVSNGSTLKGTGSTGAVTINGGGNINLVDGAVGTLTVGGLTSGGTTASVLTFEIGTGGTADSIATTTLSLSGTTDITIDNLNGLGSQTLANGTYDLITYSTLSSGALGNLTLTDSTLDGHTLTLTSLANGDLVLTVSSSGGGGSAPAQAYWSGATNSSWATTSNFNTSATSGTAIGAAPGSNTDVVFSTTSPAAGNLSTTLDAATSINSLTFAGSGAVTIASGTGGSSSTLTINAATTTGSGGLNTAPNGITMQSGAGPATISAPVILGASQTWSNASANLLTVSGGVTGTANLAIQANSTGGITFSGGSVDPTGSITNSGTGTGTTTISSVIGSNVTGVTQSGSNSTLVLSSGNTYTGSTAVNAGRLLITNGTSGSATGIGGTLSVGTNGTIGGIGTSNSTSFNISGNVIAGSGLANDTTGQTVITGTAALHNSTFANATLSFNLNSASQSSTSIDVGSTGVDLGNTTLSLTLKGSSIIAPFTSYVLIAGRNTGGLAGVDGSQYEGFTTAASGADGLAVGQYKILSGASLTFTNDLDFYAPGSFLYLNTVGGVDDIEVDVVPEPGTWAMLLGGMVLLVMWQRRKNLTAY